MQDLSTPIQRLGTDTASGLSLDFFEFAAILWRGKWRIGFFAAIGAALGIAYITQLATYRYTAKAAIAIENRQEQLVDFDSVLSGLSPDYLTISTQPQLLKARKLAERLVRKLDLMSDPEYNPFVPVPPGKINTAICTQTGLRCPKEPPPRPGPRTELDATIDRVLATLNVTNVDQSLVFEISFTATDPVKAALLADTLAELYSVEQLETKFQATERATAWMTERTADLQAQLEQAELAYESFNADTNLVSPEILGAQNRQLKDFRERLDKAREARIDIDTRALAQTTALAELEAGRSLAEVAADISVPALDAALRRFGDTPQTRQTALTLLRDLTQQTEQARTRMDTQISAISEQVDLLTASIADQSGDMIKLQQLERETEATRLLYEYFLNRQKETEVQLGLQQSDSRVISQAVVPIVPSSPRPVMVVGFSMIMGSLVGAGLVLRREMWLRGFRAAKELETTTGVTVAGQVPEAPYRQRRRLLSYVVKNQNSALVEAVRNLRTSILMSNVDREPQVIMITSSMPKEGKTTLSMTLAHSFAGLNKRVLLIEGDLRRQVFREYFKDRSKEGLVSVVGGTATLEDTVYHHDELGIDILLGSATQINAADFFSSESFRNFLKLLRQTYDIVLIDTPPVVLVPDARVIGKEADAVLYVVRWNRTPRFQVAEGMNALATANVKVTGTVLNNIDPRSMRRYVYGESYYHHYYRS